MRSRARLVAICACGLVSLGGPVCVECRASRRWQRELRALAVALLALVGVRQ